MDDENHLKSPQQIQLYKEPPASDLWDENTRFFVLVNHYDADVSWSDRIKFPHVIYDKTRPDRAPFNAINKAKSETNLLKFIIDFYDNLPQNVIIVHQYEYKGSHEGSLVDIFNDPNFGAKYEASLTPGYWSFNCYTISTIRTELAYIKSSGWWDDCMKPYFGDVDGYGDFAAGKRGAAQFVVSRERIRSLPREFYRNMYEWLTTKSLDEEITGIDPTTSGRVLTANWNHPLSNHFTSRYMEWGWELIFTAYRPTEDITMTVNGNQIAAIYGAGNYYRNVTSHVVKHYLQQDGSLMIKSTKLNDLFGDTVNGKQKVLKINLNNKEIHVFEDHSVLIK